MNFQEWADKIQAMASVYAFDIYPDGSFSEIRLMAVNQAFSGMLYRRPDAPKFYSGIPYREYFQDVNFESYCYRCASTGQPLYSYVNAHGLWLSGHYFPLSAETEPNQEFKTVFCAYILKYTPQIEDDAITKRSAEASSAVLNINVKLHKTQNFMQAMTETITEIQKICGSEKCAVLLVDKIEQKCEFITENGKHQDYLEKIAGEMQCTPYEMALSWENDLADSDCLLLNDLSVLQERDPLWYASLYQNNVRSLVLYAVRFNQKLVGFIWSANFDDDKLMLIKETLEPVSFFLGAVIANHLLVDKLEFLSMVDVLTQVRNRNAMNKRVDQLMNKNIPLPCRMGVVFADLNGLKTVNDNIGHDAGDKLLSKASSLLRSAFGTNEIYRAGGDEFVILCPDVTEDILYQQTAELRRLEAETDDVRFALGTGFFSGDYNICHAMQVADARMYQDKEDYYRRHPEKKRRVEIKE